MVYKHLFGPVPSRRLGVSLGIDLVPMKTCSYNCIYCECGKTTNLTVTRKEYVSTSEIIEEISDYLSKKPELDYITYSGSGEPTLHNGIGIITRYIKDNFPDYKIALLTNGSLFWDENVRKEVLDIDVIVPSLDAVSEKIFFKIDRPHQSLDIHNINDGLTQLRQEYSGEIWLEIFVVPDLNNSPEEIALINKEIKRIMPEKVQLNTLDRPGVVDWIRPATRDELNIFAKMIEHPNVEISESALSRMKITSFSGDILEEILQTIHRRPCTVDDLSQIFSIHINEINKYIAILITDGRIEEKRESRGIFFVAKRV